MPVLTLVINRQNHPVDHVQVQVLESELAERLAASALNVVVVIVPELGRDEEVGSWHTCRDALF